MERDFAAYLFTLFCPLFTSGASFSIAHEYSIRNLNKTMRRKKPNWSVLASDGFGISKPKLFGKRFGIDIGEICGEYRYHHYS